MMQLLRLLALLVSAITVAAVGARVQSGQTKRLLVYASLFLIGHELEARAVRVILLFIALVQVFVRTNLYNRCCLPVLVTGAARLLTKPAISVA